MGLDYDQPGMSRVAFTINRLLCVTGLDQHQVHDGIVNHMIYFVKPKNASSSVV